MSLVMLRIYKHLRASRKLASGQRAAALRMMQEDAALISGSRAAIDDSRALLNRVDVLMEGAARRI